MAHPATAGLIDHDTPAAVGSVSVMPTLVAVPGPVFFTVTMKPMVWPALTVAASAVFVTVSDGALTVTDADAWTWALLSALATAVLLRVPDVAEVVALVTCTTTE